MIGRRESKRIGNITHPKSAARHYGSPTVLWGKTLDAYFPASTPSPDPCHPIRELQGQMWRHVTKESKLLATCDHGRPARWNLTVDYGSNERALLCKAANLSSFSPRVQKRKWSNWIIRHMAICSWRPTSQSQMTSKQTYHSIKAQAQKSSEEANRLTTGVISINQIDHQPFARTIFSMRSFSDRIRSADTRIHLKLNVRFWFRI